jgi:hypothetical protein
MKSVLWRDLVKDNVYYDLDEHEHAIALIFIRREGGLLIFKPAKPQKRYIVNKEGYIRFTVNGNQEWFEK